jgi:hypothetical protein
MNEIYKHPCNRTRNAEMKQCMILCSVHHSLKPPYILENLSPMAVCMARKRLVSKTIEWHQEIMDKAAIDPEVRQVGQLANCLAACRIATALPAGMADLEAMARAIAYRLTSLEEITLELSAGWHPASTDILAKPETMPAEPKDSIQALRDGRTNKRIRETQLVKSKSLLRYNAGD